MDNLVDIILENDKFKEKATKVTENLEKLCAERNIYFIKNANNIDTRVKRKPTNTVIYLN